jgi:hypothetical protein
MLRFISGNLTTIDGVSIFPVLSLLIFVIFFAVMLTMVFRMKKKDIAELGQIPFEDDVKYSDYNKKD